jgi:hypothetical protein
MGALMPRARPRLRRRPPPRFRRPLRSRRRGFRENGAAGSHRAGLSAAANAPSGAPLVYRPALLAAARLHFVDQRQKLDVWQTVRHLVFSDPASGRLRWTDVQPAPEGEAREPAAGAAHKTCPPTGRSQALRAATKRTTRRF